MSSERELDRLAADERRVRGPADGARELGGAVESVRDVFRLVRVGAERDLHAGAEVSVVGIKGEDPANKNDLANPELVKIEESTLKIAAGILEAKQVPFSFMVYRIPVKK